MNPDPSDLPPRSYFAAPFASTSSGPSSRPLPPQQPHPYPQPTYYQPQGYFARSYASYPSYSSCAPRNAYQPSPYHPPQHSYDSWQAVWLAEDRHRQQYNADCHQKDREHAARVYQQQQQQQQQQQAVAHLYASPAPPTHSPPPPPPRLPTPPPPPPAEPYPVHSHAPVPAQLLVAPQLSAATHLASPALSPSPNLGSVPASRHIRFTEDRINIIEERASFKSLLDRLDMSSETNTLLADLSGMTVDRLKLTIRRMNETAGTHLKLSGLKQELYLRIRDELTLQAGAHDKSKYIRIKAVINECKDGVTSPSSTSSYQNANWRAQALVAPLPAYNRLPAASSSNQNSYAGLLQKPAALPPPRFAQASNASAGAGGSWQNTTTEEIPIRFRSSPFYRVEKSLSMVQPLPKAAQGDRKSAFCSFALTEAQRAMLAASKASPTNPQYQVRLFCTNEEYFNPSRTASAQQPAPMDFPGTCEVKLNAQNVVANTKGIKKQAGTAPPVNLSQVGDALNLAPSTLNKVEVVYVNTEKKYFLVVYLVQVTSVAQIVETIKKAKYRAKEDVIQSIVTLNSDPDVVATSYGLSLKDPLTMARIKTPIRSIHCSHIGCFDAQTFFMMMEQTPTWGCPICSKVLRTEDIAVDGYFDDVLKTCPSSIDAVTIEPDGTWRSSDDKHGTGQPKSIVPSRAGTADLDKGKGRAQNQDLSLVLDSDDDDERPPQRAAISIGSSPEPGPRRTDVIDLTLDSDEEEMPVRPKVLGTPLSGEGSRSGSVGVVQAQAAFNAKKRMEEMKRKREDVEEEARPREW